MKKEFIIFDFDGTIANTNDIIVESWQAAFRKYLGHELDRREIEATFGEVLRDTIAVKIPGADVDEVINYYRAYQDANCAGKVYVFDGVRELILALKDGGYAVGVATSRTSYSFWNYMKEFGLENMVDAVVTVDDVTHHKPHGESVTACLAKLTGQDPALPVPQDVLDASIMIGDTKYDVGCAMNAGVDSVLVGYSHYIDEEDMADSGFAPTYRIGTPEELLEIINNN